MDDELDKELDFSQSASISPSPQNTQSPLIVPQSGSPSRFGITKRAKIMIGIVIILAIILAVVSYLRWA